MASPALEPRFRPSVLDRLLPAKQSNLIGSYRPDSLESYKRAVMRDLTWLLNTRRAAEVVASEFDECEKSALTYGVPDFSYYSLRSAPDQGRLRTAVEDAIRMFEPRLMKVVVHLEPRNDLSPVLHFRVEALLRMEPAPEPVVFDTVLHADTARFSVTAEDV